MKTLSGGEDNLLDLEQLLPMAHTGTEGDETQLQIGADPGGTAVERYIRDETFHDETIVFAVSTVSIPLISSILPEPTNA